MIHLLYPPVSSAPLLENPPPSTNFRWCRGFPIATLDGRRGWAVDSHFSWIEKTGNDGNKNLQIWLKWLPFRRPGVGMGCFQIGRGCNTYILKETRSWSMVEPPPVKNWKVMGVHHGWDFFERRNRKQIIGYSHYSPLLSLISPLFTDIIWYPIVISVKSSVIPIVHHWYPYYIPITSLLHPDYIPVILQHYVVFFHPYILW